MGYLPCENLNTKKKKKSSNKHYYELEKKSCKICSKYL